MVQRRQDEFLVAASLPRILAERDRRFAANEDARGWGNWQLVGADAANDSSQSSCHLPRISFDERAEVENAIAERLRIPSCRPQCQCVVAKNHVVDVRRQRLWRLGNLARGPLFEMRDNRGRTFTL